MEAGRNGFRKNFQRLRLILHFFLRNFFGKVIQERLAEKKWIRDRLSAKNVVIVDARPPKQYSGEEGEEIRRGHIPGAKNIFWEMSLEGEEVRIWKKKEDLEKLFAESGVTKDKEIIVYCRDRKGSEPSLLHLEICSWVSPCSSLPRILGRVVCG